MDTAPLEHVVRRAADDAVDRPGRRRHAACAALGALGLAVALVAAVDLPAATPAPVAVGPPLVPPSAPAVPAPAPSDRDDDDERPAPSTRPQDTRTATVVAPAAEPVRVEVVRVAESTAAPQRRSERPRSATQTPAAERPRVSGSAKAERGRPDAAAASRSDDRRPLVHVRIGDLAEIELSGRDRP